MGYIIWTAQQQVIRLINANRNNSKIPRKEQRKPQKKKQNTQEKPDVLHGDNGWLSWFLLCLFFSKFELTIISNINEKQ